MVTYSTVLIEKKHSAICTNTEVVASLMYNWELSHTSNMSLKRQLTCDHNAETNNIHRVRKKGTNSILGITSSNTGRFTKFFKCHNLLEICNKTIIKFPTTPQTRRYTTL